MFDTLSWFFLEKAHAQIPNVGGAVGSALNSTNTPRGGIFDLFKPPTGSSSAITSPGVKFASLITFVISWVLAIVAVIAFIYLIINGVKYITAGGDAAKATEARNGLINAIIGIIVVVIAFTIMRFAAGLGGAVGGTLN